MASKADAKAIVIDQQTLIEGVAKYFLEKVYGADGMPWGTRFNDLEELSVQIGQAMSRSMIDQCGTAGSVSAIGGRHLLGLRRPG